MRKKIVAGNWKMNKTLGEGEELIREILSLLQGVSFSAEVVIAPPFTNLDRAAKQVAGTALKLSAQNCSSEASGALTGEVSAQMIKAAGASHVIIGHSERRMKFSEGNEVLFKKIKLALENGLVPVYCIGETLAEREKKTHFDVVQQQLQEVIFKLQAGEAQKIILAYEPVWAIGTGKTATPAQAQEMHQYIRSLTSRNFGSPFAPQVRILYGGSCTAQNAAELFAQPDVDGGLIGGASLKAHDFVQIIKAAG